ncbi:hypothetical protein AB6A40_003747 [Gnathostoma spinigerum]|uniref:Dynactin subunit 4 n=1 Tax=Gnathostoma spinigerum TaxID=75299 RepID=A0ABD6EJ88_9BILA
MISDFGCKIYARFMASLLNIDRVQYQCSCGEWMSVNRLYFCRHCSQLKCTYCTAHEVDSVFCPTCLDTVSTGEARQKKNRCPNCYQCPICGANVVLRAANNVYHLSCNTCRWTTSDAGLPDISKTTSWPEYMNEHEDFLTCVLDQMKVSASFEKAQRERHKYTKRRSNLGSMFSDRFGLQTIYSRRKAALTERTPSEAVKVSATDDVVEVSDAFISQESMDMNIPDLIQTVNQPLANGRPLLPIRTPLTGRRGVRCKQCDHSLCKAEYNPNSIKFKIQVLAGSFVPDIRLSRPVTLVAGQWCPVFLTVSNFSATPCRVVVSPDSKEEPFYVKCETTPVEVSLPSRDETLEIDESFDNTLNETGGVIVFRKRHRVGIRMSVMAEDDSAMCFGLIVKYINSSSSFDSQGAHEWLEHHVKVFLKDNVNERLQKISDDVST